MEIKGFVRGILLVMCPAVQAESLSLELNAGKYITDIDSAQFRVTAAEVRAAYYLQPLVAIEAYANGGFGSDEDLDLEYQVSYSTGLALRLESPVNNDTRAFAQFGYGLSEIELERSESGKPVKDEFDGLTYGGGIEISPFRDAALRLNLSYRRYYGDEGIDLDYGSIGFRVVFE